jgi:hypothetical protein
MRLPGYDESLQTVKQQGVSSESKTDPQKKTKKKELRHNQRISWWRALHVPTLIQGAKLRLKLEEEKKKIYTLIRGNSAMYRSVKAR